MVITKEAHLHFLVKLEITVLHAPAGSASAYCMCPVSTLSKINSQFVTIYARPPCCPGSTRPIHQNRSILGFAGKEIDFRWRTTPVTRNQKWQGGSKSNQKRRKELSLCSCTRKLACILFLAWLVWAKEFEMNSNYRRVKGNNLFPIIMMNRAA